jgi:hypothetical protein
MKYKLIIAPQSSLLNYVEKQAEHIESYFSNITVDIVSTDSEYLTLYNTKPTRFPCIILLKNNAYKNSINAKLTNDALVKWLINNSVN